MARKRMIDPNIWQSEDFSKLDFFSKLVFIGLFSLADDEGRGRANPTYLKSSIFPYDEVVRTTDVEKSLSQISANMSIVFYEHNESKYYELLNWNKWQKIDRPSPSKIPEYDENAMKTIFDNNSTNVRRVVAPNKKENKNRREEKKAPTLEEIEKYVIEKGLKVNAKQFYDYFSEGNWTDSKGNKVKNWKQKILTWNKYEESKQSQKPVKQSNFQQREYTDLNKLYVNGG